MPCPVDRPAVDIGFVFCEPTTAATDWGLAALCALIAFRLRKHYLGTGQRSVRWVGAAMLAGGASFLFGGVQHAFAAYLYVDSWVWELTLIAAALSAFCLLSATATSVLTGAARYVLMRGAMTATIVYCTLVLLGLRQFFHLALFYLPAMALLLALSFWCWKSRNEHFGLWLGLGALVTLVGAGVQVQELAPHFWFNHNDLFHTIQAGAMLLFYRGARLLSDRASPHENVAGTSSGEPA